MKVLSVPAQHPYTQAIRPQGVEYLPDPDINGNWWPHPALDASWWRGRSDVDVLHIHFGFEHKNADELRMLIDELHRARIPLVVTVHDLVNPHLDDSDQERHYANTAVLVEGADQVVTLTDGAAQEIAQRYGRGDAWVIPHPAVVPAGGATAERNRSGVAVFLKSLRSNAVTDPEFYHTIAQEVELTVYLHDEDATARFGAELGARGVSVVKHARMSDDELHAAVASHVACVLPYLRGTHSGWLEMCRDLGTTVAAPDCGMFGDQADAPGVVEVYRTGDGADAARAAATLVERGAVPYAGDRAARDAQIRDDYAHVYERAVRAAAETLSAKRGSE
ncbi:glycosyltransferase family 4 protein [Corynebacterium aquatimens]|uniref:Glycosyltransferase subfamily 4-like N-terminal domain-containing protein n=1 Tax=Corynebacterium aquatimens TaxID=1190508 RepID=A0A931E005_9CORY|nr:glycosyltransferase family 4 protein [Corynebacterium aquatimens]MBG6122194.1 hypothetical protein [Corynebacterium aquatimens]WJY65265.1 hypothetical protein CAQUA_02730 [Corynebacterium aquatimens]